MVRYHVISGDNLSKLKPGMALTLLFSSSTLLFIPNLQCALSCNNSIVEFLIPRTYKTIEEVKEIWMFPNFLLSR